MELKIREFLRNTERLEPLLSTTLLKVDAFASSVLSEEIEAALGRLLGAQTFRWGIDIIEKVALKLTDLSDGIARDLLTKSVQETLFYCVGTDPDLSPSQFRSRLKRHIHEHGSSALTHRFAKLSVFNNVWFHIGESFRMAALTPHSFERDLEDVEQTCGKIVASVWIGLNLAHGPLDASAATEFFAAVERRLRGEPA